MCSGSEAGSYLRLIDFVYHSQGKVEVLTREKTALEASLVETKQQVLFNSKP